MRTAEYRNGKLRPKHVKGGNFVFEKMSEADVWNLIATAARASLYRVPRRQRKKAEPPV